MDGDEVGVCEAGHGLGFAEDALAALFVEAVGADGAEGDFAVEAGVMGEEDALASALAEEAADGVSARRQRRRGGEWRLRELALGSLRRRAER